MIRLPRPSWRWQRRLTRALQLVLVGIVIYGLLAGQPKAITNGLLSLSVTAFPAALRRRYEVPIDPWLGVWITAAVCLHSLGSAGLYGSVGWWDNLTHALSATLVAAVGYTAARALDLHDDRLHVPPRFYFVYVLVMVLSFGVLWELFEFGLDVAAESTGVTMPLAQEGLSDTMRDLMFNTVGAVLVAAFGQAHLTGVADRIRIQLVGER